MGRFLCFPVNYNCLISFWKLKADGGLGGGVVAHVSIVKGQLQDVPYSSELTRSVVALSREWDPIQISGRRIWGEGAASPFDYITQSFFSRRVCTCFYRLQKGEIVCT